MQVNNDSIFALGMPDKLTVDKKPESYEDFIKFGDNNLFPQEIAKLCRESVSHRSIINSKHIFVNGAGLDGDTDKISELNIKDTFNKCTLDDLFFGNSYIEIVTDSKKLYFKFYHIDSSIVRINKDNTGAVLHPDWAAYRKNDGKGKEISLYPNFTKDGKVLRSIYHIKSYEPEFKFYGVPDWFAGLKSAVIIRQTNEWNKSELANNFSISGILAIPGVNSVEEAKILDKKLKSYQGAEKAGLVLPHYLRDLGTGESREKLEFVDFTKDRSGNWIDLHRQSDDDLIKIHNWYKSLAAFTENTGFDTQRIINDYKMASATIIPLLRDKFMNVFKQISLDFGIVLDVFVKNNSPIAEIHNTEYVWEVRKKQGLEYDENDPRQQIFYADLLKGGSNVNR